MPIPVYASPNPSSHQFCLGIYVLAGSMYESADVSGITHLYEHTVFRNLKHRFDRDFALLLTENGLTFNASTYREFLHFEICGLPSGIPFACRIAEELFVPIRITGDEYNAEKRRIKAEIRENAEHRTLAHLADGEIWRGTSLSQAITGTCGTVDRVSMKRLNEFRESILTEGNIFAYVTGKVDESDVARITRALDAIPLREGVIRDNTAPVPDNFGRRDCSIVTGYGDFCHVGLSFDVDNSRVPVGVRDLLYEILFSGEIAMLFRGLSEDVPLVYSYDSTLEEYRNVSVVKFRYEVRYTELEQALTETVRILERLKAGDFCFDANLTKLLAGWEIMQDDAVGLNWSLAYENHILGGGAIDYAKPGFGRFDGITKDAVTAGAKAVFTPANAVVAVKGDRKRIDTDMIRRIVNGLG